MDLLTDIANLLDKYNKRFVRELHKLTRIKNSRR
jgi:hypothetical protein